MNKKHIAGMAASLSLLFSASALAQSGPVKIGVIFPLSGSLASTGTDLQAAAQVAEDIINNPHPELKGLPLAEGSGLPKLGGAKLDLIFADSQGQPNVGLASAQRLIDNDQVVALDGSYQSAVTKTASRVAEQRGIPFMNGSSSSPDLTEQGYHWFFRTSPTDATFIENMMQFLDTIKNQPTKRIAVVYENTDFGVNTFKAVQALAAKYHHEIVANIAYTAGTTSVNAEVGRLAAAKPDVAIFASYTSDAMLFVRTMKDMKYAPPIFMANDAGFIDPRFIQEMGSQVQGVITRDVWADGLTSTKPLLKQVNDMFKAKTGHDLNGNSARELEAVLVLADAINRAGSTKPDAIRAALAATDLKAAQVAMPWEGVKFDAKGQNIYGSGLILQMDGPGYKTIWPTAFKTDAKLPVLPFTWK